MSRLVIVYLGDWLDWIWDQLRCMPLDSYRQQSPLAARVKNVQRCCKPEFSWLPLLPASAGIYFATDITLPSFTDIRIQIFWKTSASGPLNLQRLQCQFGIHKASVLTHWIATRFSIFSSTDSHCWTNL